MLPSEKMALRVVLVQHLTQVDDELTRGMASGFGTASLRAAAEARNLLTTRRAICDEMLTVGYQPWAMPTNVEESKAI
jgi:hypothetical protein